MKQLNFRGVSVDTWVRTIALAIVLLNQVFAMFGKSFIPFAEAEIYQGLSGIATIVVTVWAAWKNNSFSEKAQQADEYMGVLKEGENK